MSLKSFHIFFIVTSILLAFGFGGWAIRVHLVRTSVSYLALGIGSLLMGIGLILYGWKAFRELQRF